MARAPKQTIYQHIKELRNRLFLVATVFVTASAAAYAVKDTLLRLILEPLGQQSLTYLTPGGGFSFIFNITMWCGLAVTFPFIVFSLYRFIRPVLPKKAQHKSLSILFGSFALFAAGAAFGYFFAVPGALRFLTTFAEQYVTASLTADSYLNFILAYTMGLGVLFQLPLILVIINWVKPLKPKPLFLFERYVIVLSFVAAAIVTPTPDAINQTIIAAPIILMYQVGVFLVIWSNYRAKKRAQKQQLSQAKTAPVTAVRVGRPKEAVLQTQTPAATMPIKTNSPTLAAHQRVAAPRPMRSLDGFSSSASSMAMRSQRSSHPAAIKKAPVQPSHAPTAPIAPAPRPTATLRVPTRRTIDGVSLSMRPQRSAI